MLCCSPVERCAAVHLSTFWSFGYYLPQGDGYLHSATYIEVVAMCNAWFGNRSRCAEPSQAEMRLEMRIDRELAWRAGACIHAGSLLCAAGVDNPGGGLLQNILRGAVRPQVHAQPRRHCAAGQTVHAAHHIQRGAPVVLPSCQCGAAAAWQLLECKHSPHILQCLICATAVPDVAMQQVRLSYSEGMAGLQV